MLPSWLQPTVEDERCGHVFQKDLSRSSSGLGTASMLSKAPRFDKVLPCTRCIIWLTVSSATVAVGFRCCRKSCQHFFPHTEKDIVALISFFRRWGTILARSMLLCTIRLICLYLPVHRQSMCSETIRCFPTGSFKHNASANGRLMPLQKRQINFPIRMSCNPSCPLLFH